MVLEIVFGIVALITTNSIVSNVKHNRSVTKDFTRKERSKLLWRYGPFKIDSEIADQLLKDEQKRFEISNEQVNNSDQAA